jgi:hypothetical protein
MISARDASKGRWTSVPQWPLWMLTASATLAMGCDRLLGRPTEESESTASSSSQAGSTSSSAHLAPAVPPSQLLASVNRAPISQTDLELRVQELKLTVETQGQPWSPLTREQIQELRDVLVNEELMAQAVLARGLDLDPDVQRRFAYIRRAFYAQEWIRWQQARLQVSPEEVEAYYEQFKMGFREPEKLRLRMLVVATETEAKQALVGLLQGSNFTGGLIENWVMRSNDKALFAPDDASIQSLDPVLEQAAFAIDKDGGISNYVRGPDGRFYLFQRVQRTDPVYKSLTEVWDAIQNLLFIEKLQQAAEQLQATAEVERFPEHLEELVEPEAETEPGGS